MRRELAKHRTRVRKCYLISFVVVMVAVVVIHAFNLFTHYGIT